MLRWLSWDPWVSIVVSRLASVVTVSKCEALPLISLNHSLSSKMNDNGCFLDVVEFMLFIYANSRKLLLHFQLNYVYAFYQSILLSFKIKFIECNLSFSDFEVSSDKKWKKTHCVDVFCQHLLFHTFYTYLDFTNSHVLQVKVYLLFALLNLIYKVKTCWNNNLLGLIFYGSTFSFNTTMELSKERMK